MSFYMIATVVVFPSLVRLLTDQLQRCSLADTRPDVHPPPYTVFSLRCDRANVACMQGMVVWAGDDLHLLPRMKPVGPLLTRHCVRLSGECRPYRSELSCSVKS